MSEEQKNTEDARGEAIKAIVSRIGHGITLQEANILIRTVLVNWHKAQTE